MTEAETDAPDATRPERGSRVRLPRSRGVVSGVLLVLAGVWAAFVPFVGPAFDFAYTPKPDDTWHWTAARGWFEVLPGGLAVFGGLLLILSANRILTILGAWLAALAGGWLVVAQQVSYLLTLGSPGTPSAPGDRRYVAEYLAFFTGIGALIILFAAVAIGRLSVRSVRDLRAAERRDEQALAEREAAERQVAEREAADREIVERNAGSWSTAGGVRGYGSTEPLPVPAPVSHEPAASAVTTELPVAPQPEEHQPHQYTAGPDDDTAALPVVAEHEPPAQPVTQEPEPETPEPETPEPETPEPETREPETPEPETPEPETPEPETPEPETPEPETPEPETPEPETPEPETPEPETPEPETPEPETPEPETPEPETPEPETPEPETPEPETPEPETPEPETQRGDVHTPRRYFGSGTQAEPEQPAAPEHPYARQQPALPRDAVRTDEDDDLDGLDLDPRSR